jgi:hypothetical protein
MDRGPLRGHNNTPFGRPTPGRPVGRLGVGHPQGVFGSFDFYQLVMLILNMVCLTVTLAFIYGWEVEGVEPVWEAALTRKRGHRGKPCMGVWQGVAMDFLKYH